MALMAFRHTVDDPVLGDILALIHDSFADMKGRIDPPSSVQFLDIIALQKDAKAHEVWSLGTPPRACAIFKVTSDALYIGKVAVQSTYRRQGLATQLINLANSRAKHHRLSYLTLHSRVELIENHATFTALGFTEAARTAHKGYDKPTSITFKRAVSQPNTSTARASTSTPATRSISAVSSSNA